MTVISSCERKSIGPDQLHVPAFLEQAALDKFGDARASLEPHGGRKGGRSAECALRLVLRPVCAAVLRRATRRAPERWALDDSGGDGGIGVLVDDDEAAHGAVLAIGIEEQRQAWF